MSIRWALGYKSRAFHQSKSRTQTNNSHPKRTLSLLGAFLLVGLQVLAVTPVSAGVPTAREEAQGFYRVNALTFYYNGNYYYYNGVPTGAANGAGDDGDFEISNGKLKVTDGPVFSLIDTVNAKPCYDVIYYNTKSLIGKYEQYDNSSPSVGQGWTHVFSKPDSGVCSKPTFVELGEPTDQATDSKIAFFKNNSNNFESVKLTNATAFVRINNVTLPSGVSALFMEAKPATECPDVLIFYTDGKKVGFLHPEKVGVSDGNSDSTYRQMLQARGEDNGSCGAPNKDSSKKRLFDTFLPLKNTVHDWASFGNMGNSIWTMDPAVASTNVNFGAGPALERTKSVTAAKASADTANLNEADDCPVSEDSALRWILCPLIKLGDNTIGKLDGVIAHFLYTPVDQIMNGVADSASKFRNFGLAMIVIAGLVMVFSQALGFEFFDAYTIKKIMPRLFVAAIGITLSTPILIFLINISNDIGLLIYKIVASSVVVNNATDVGGGTIGGAVAIGATGLAVAMGAGGFLALIGTILLSLLVGLFVLAIRQMVIMVCVLLAPIAIAAYILPGTQKFWNFWQNALTTSLLMFPIIMAFIASGEMLSNLLAQSGSTQMQLLSVIVRYAPFVLLPFAFKLAGGLMSTIFSLANDRTKGGFDRLKNSRANSRKALHEQRMAGMTRLGSGKTGRAYRRFAAPGTGFNPMASGRARFKANERIIANKSAAAALEADGGRAVGDDDATALATQAGMTRSKFVSQYMARTGGSAADANTALASLEQGLGAKIGTGAMQVAAFKARAASSTAYSGDAAGTAQRINEGAALIRQGLITSSDATVAGKGNRARLDISGRGFGDQMKAFDAAAKDGPINIAQAEEYLDKTLQGAEPGDMLAGNTRTVTAMAPSMMRNLEHHIVQRSLAAANGDTAGVEAADQAVNRALGQIAGVQDNLNRTSPEKAALFADLVNGKLVKNMDGSEVTVRQMVSDAANRAPGQQGYQSFLEVRKEYGSAVPRGNITAEEAARLAAEEAERQH